MSTYFTRREFAVVVALGVAGCTGSGDESSGQSGESGSSSGTNPGAATGSDSVTPIEPYDSTGGSTETYETSNPDNEADNNNAESTVTTGTATTEEGVEYFSVQRELTPVDASQYIHMEEQNGTYHFQPSPGHKDSFDDAYGAKNYNVGNTGHEWGQITPSNSLKESYSPGFHESGIVPFVFDDEMHNDEVYLVVTDQTPVEKNGGPDGLEPETFMKFQGPLPESVYSEVRDGLYMGGFDVSSLVEPGHTAIVGLMTPSATPGIASGTAKLVKTQGNGFGTAGIL